MNNNVYIHELIDIHGHNRDRYMHHMTANWCPNARVERDQLCFGVWATVGSTGRWPEVVNLWQLPGWEGLAANFAHEFKGKGRTQDPTLAEWWGAAASLRRGGVDRIIVPAPWSPPIEELTEAGTRGELYVHETVHLGPGNAPAYLDALHELGRSWLEGTGATLIGAWWTAMVEDDEVITIWAYPDWRSWAKAQSDEPSGADGGGWPSRRRALGAISRRFVMIDAPLGPLRLGRQPAVEDRRPLSEV